MADEYSIPDDFEVVEGGNFALAGGVPELWHHKYYGIAEIHAKFRALGVEPGDGEVIAINDTGSTTHDMLPTPIAARSFVRGESHVSRHVHGPHCAGIALGRDGLGVAPGAKLIVAKVLSDSGGGSNAGINAGRVWAAKEGATIVSESLGDNGGPPFQQDLEAFDQAYSAGVSLCVAALGNSGMRGVGRPASYNRSAGIANHRRDGSIAPSSSRGSTADLGGPGTQIVSSDQHGGLATLTGTSMACPFVAACFALIRHWMRITGTPIPQGHEAWRAWWQSPEFVKDVGAPGKDTSFGDGVLRMKNILDVIRMSTWVLAFVLLSMSMAVAQQPLDVTIKPAEVVTTVETIKRTTVTYAGEVLDETNETTGTKDRSESVVSIVADQPIRRVTAFTKAFDFGKLTRRSPTEYLLRGQSGVYLVTVYTGDDFFQDVVKLEGSAPAPDTKLRAALEAKLPDDPTFAAVLAGTYDAVIAEAEGKTLRELRRTIGRSKVKAFSKPRDTSKPWNTFFLVVDDWAETADPDVGQYRSALAEVASVLREASQKASSVLETEEPWVAPFGVYRIGDVYNGRVLSKQCDGVSGCRLVWKEIK